jgi:hypothetical protein
MPAKELCWLRNRADWRLKVVVSTVVADSRSIAPITATIVVSLYTDQSAFGGSRRFFRDNFRFGHRLGWRDFDCIADIGLGYVLFLAVRGGLITEGNIAFSIGGAIDLRLRLRRTRETETQYGGA